MKKAFIYFFVIIGFGLSLPSAVLAQSYEKQRKQIIQKQESTRSEIEELNNQIGTYEQRLKKTSQKYSSLYKKYQNQKRLIALRDEKISKLKKKQSQIEGEIGIINNSIEEHEQELSRLIKNHKKILKYIYKHGKTSELGLLLASPTINQMLIRAYYLKKFNNYREEQVRAIKETEKKLRANRKDLKEVQEENKSLLAEIREEKEVLNEKKKKQESNVALLRKDKQKIQERIDRVKQQKQELNSTLTDLIAQEEEVRKAHKEKLRRQREAREKKLAEAKDIEEEEERAEEIAKVAPPPEEPEEFLSEDELHNIELKFANQKGSLPWPVESSTISEHFGRQRHPVYGTYTNNLGIEIITQPRAPVHAVFRGYVISIHPFPGYGEVVLVKHGRFITAYGNLSRVTVRKGMVLDQGDQIGLAGDQDSTKGESVFFLIRKDNDNLDPEHWLKNK